MPQLITRRSLLSNALKTSLGLAILQTMKGGPTTLLAETVTPQVDRFAPAFQRLDQFIARHMSELGLPGMTVAIADRKGLLRASQYGFADLKTQTRPTPQTLFEIGSISKSFVAIATMQLVEEGKLDLQKPVKDYLPWLKIESSFAPITTHHLLSHTSGLSGVPLLMRVAATTLRTGFAPGSNWVYSNIGYVLLGFLLETLDQRPLSEVLRRRVLSPIGMTMSEPAITNSIRGRVAIGYNALYPDRPFPLKGQLAEAPWVEVPEGAGSVAATAADMGGYLRMLLNSGMGGNARVLSEKTFERFTAPVIKSPFHGEDASYAYGLWVSDNNGHKLLRHTGGMIAFSSAMYADLTDGFGAFASVNARVGGGYRPVEVTQYALNLLSAAAAGRELPAPPPVPPAPDKIKNAADYAGTFTATDGSKLVLASEGEQLLLVHNGQRVVLEQMGRDHFIVKHPEFDMFLLAFGREKNVVVEAFHGSRWWTNERYAGPKTFEYPKEWDALTGHYRSDSPWYGSSRVVIRKGRLLFDGEAPLAPVEPGVFRLPGATTADWIAFDTIVNGKATHLNYSGIEFFRTFTP
jgi:CubicO group peptidase (beta-lactamase class C family)